jgi:DNA processing protein
LPKRIGRPGCAIPVARFALATDAPSLLPWLQLSLVPGVTGATLRRLLAAFHSPAAVLAQTPSALGRIVDPALATAIARGPAAPQVDAALAWANGPHRSILTPEDVRYPALLLETPDPPAVLYAAGQIDRLLQPAVAVVGSRNASAQGIRNAEAFARSLSDAGVCVVSGLALGIDAAAHRGGLRGAGSSIAVLGSGIDVIYPRRNADLFDQLTAAGLVLSEFPLSTAPIPPNFPRRNRIISGLARGCLVVEAALASGSLVTARIAVDLGRDVFAVPGSIHSPLAKGCHYLIKQGAKLVETAQDVLDELALGPHRGTVPMAQQTDAEPEVSTVLAALGHDPCDLDSLAARTHLSIDRLLALLMQLEIEGRVALTQGANYQRLD